MRLFQSGTVRGARKFTVTYTALILTTLANVCGSLDGAAYAGVVTGIVIAYMGGNAMVKKFTNGNGDAP